MNKPLNVLLTGARAPITLDLARLFAYQNHTVYCADSVRTPIAKVSKAITKFYKVPSARFETRAYIEKLIQIIQKHNIDLLIPTCEEIFFIAQHLQTLNQYTTVFCDKFTKLKELHNKYTITELTSNYTITAPTTHFLESTQSLKHLPNPLNEYVLKPVFSRFARYTLIKPSPEQIKKLVITPETPWIAQDFIAGTEFSTYSICLNGQLTAYSGYRSKYRAGQGSGIYYIRDNLSQIKKFIQDFCQDQNYHGQISFDFIQNATGKIYLIECNPRATSGLHLFSNDVNLPEAFYKSENIIYSDLSNKMLSLAMLVYAFPQSLKSRKFKNFIQDLKCARDVMRAPNDNFPFYYQIYSLLDIVGTALLKRENILNVATADIEYNG